MEFILKVLKENRGNYVSGETLAQISGITRAGIWKQIGQLREIGYQIDSSPHKGYRLLSLPPVLNEFEIKDGLHTSSFGQVVYYQFEVDSTIGRARELANQGAVEGTLVIAETQSQGRGRMGRSWVSAPGFGLWVSLILRPKISASALAGITLLTAVTMAEAIKFTTGIQIKIKWPNDLIYEERKLAGIHAEVHGEMDLVHYLILSIGVNVNHDQNNFPPELLEKVTSLKMINQVEFSRILLLQNFLTNFETAYFALPEKGMAVLVEYAKEHSATIGKTVKINQGLGRTLVGAAIDLDLDGSLLMKEPDGKIIKVYSGDLLETGDS